MTQQSESETLEILSCPFCGGTNLYFIDYGVGDQWAVHCECGASGQIGSTKPEAVRLWSNRSEVCTTNIQLGD